MSDSRLAVQLYTLREFLKTPADIATTLHRVKQMGYDAVQLSALGKIEPEELAKMLREEGLICCATHTPMEKLRDDPEHVIDEHKLWDCKYTAIGHHKVPTAREWETFAATLNGLAAKYASSDLKIGYHNHSHELALFDGRRALDILIDNCSKDVWFEIDTYWIQHGGGDPAAWIDRVANRIPCVHLKDMQIKTDRTQLMAEVGEGNLNWTTIFQACERAGVEWYIVEQDTCQRDPFDSLAMSLRNLRQMGMR